MEQSKQWAKGGGHWWEEKHGVSDLPATAGQKARTTGEELAELHRYTYTVTKRLHWK